MRTREDGRDAMDNELRVGDLNCYARRPSACSACLAFSKPMAWRFTCSRKAATLLSVFVASLFMLRSASTGARELSGIPVYANRYIYSARSRVHHRKPQSEHARRRLTNSPNASCARNVCTTRVFVRLQYGHCIRLFLPVEGELQCNQCTRRRMR